MWISDIRMGKTNEGVSIKPKILFATALAALSCTVGTAAAHPGHLGRYQGSGGYEPPVHKVKRPAAKKKLHGRELWKYLIRKRFDYWGRHFGRPFTAGDYETALRVVYRESGWNPDAHNGSFHGLFQIMYSHAPQRNLFDPKQNIEVAAQLWGRLGWSPWSQTAY